MRVFARRTVAMTENDSLTAFLAEHPRMIGALFTMCLLLAQAGPVVAGNGSTTG